MATQNQSLRLHRLASTIDSRNKSVSMFDSGLSETFKLPALNAINKSVKYNDLSYATTRALDKLRKEPEQADNIEELAVHHSLMSVRKKYDNMSKTKEQQEHTILTLQTERDKFQNLKDKFTFEKTEGTKKVHSREEELQGIRGQLEETDMEKKVMLNMVARLKSDKIVYDLRKFKLEKELVYIQKQKQIILRENAGKQEEEDKTRKVYIKLNEHLLAEQRERETHIASMMGMINEKQTVLQNGQIRQSEMKEIAESTLQDKDAKEKNWYKVYLCHRFVERLLRDKMTREMMKFNTVQVAFKNIKTATGVIHAEELVKKFLNKESAYGELLGKIAEDERQIGELKSENDALTKERKKLKTEKEHLNANRKEFKDLSKEEKEFQAISDRSLKCHMINDKLSTWIDRNLKKFNTLEGKQEEADNQSNHTNTVAHLKLYLQKMNLALDETQNASVEEIKFEQIKNESNIRIRLGEAQQEKPAKNQANMNDEDDYVNNQRQEMIRNNQKFMKDVKKKYEEIKKAKMDAEPKTKTVVVEKPKAPPADKP